MQIWVALRHPVKLYHARAARKYEAFFPEFIFGSSLSFESWGRERLHLIKFISVPWGLIQWEFGGEKQWHGSSNEFSNFPAIWWLKLWSFSIKKNFFPPFLSLHCYEFVCSFFEGKNSLRQFSCDFPLVFNFFLVKQFSWLHPLCPSDAHQCSSSLSFFLWKFTLTSFLRHISTAKF